jgi:hypothetical protein
VNARKSSFIEHPQIEPLASDDNSESHREIQPRAAATMYKRDEDRWEAFFVMKSPKSSQNNGFETIKHSS